jgi:molybdate transport system substrate-binding protein
VSRGAAAVAAGLLTLVSACASGASGAGGTSGPASGATSATSGQVRGTVTVLAAASLKESFGTLAGRFEAAHPGTRVRLSFGASSGLAAQIRQGAPADVFASASEKTMEQVVRAGDAERPAAFARNTMEIAVPAGNPAGVRTVADLARPGTTVALCQPQVPCGAAAAELLAKARVAVTPVTREADVKAVLTKVSLGEVDAGVVYVTDIRSAGRRVIGVPVPDSVNATTTYPVAALKRAPNPGAADAFAAYVLSPDGQSVLRAAGFAAP